MTYRLRDAVDTKAQRATFVALCPNRAEVFGDNFQTVGAAVLDRSDFSGANAHIEFRAIVSVSAAGQTGVAALYDPHRDQYVAQVETKNTTPTALRAVAKSHPDLASCELRVLARGPGDRPVHIMGAHLVIT